jgi:hypothetical protein
MRDETPNETAGKDAELPPVGDRRTPARMPGATVSIPPRTAAGALLGPTTLHARLALLRPQPVRLKPSGREN